MVLNLLNLFIWFVYSPNLIIPFIHHSYNYLFIYFIILLYFICCYYYYYYYYYYYCCCCCCCCCCCYFLLSFFFFPSLTSWFTKTLFLINVLPFFIQAYILWFSLVFNYFLIFHYFNKHEDNFHNSKIMKFVRLIHARSIRLWWGPYIWVFLF